MSKISDAKEKSWEELFDYFFLHNPNCSYKESGTCICQRKDIKEAIIKIRSLAQQEILDTVEKEIEKLGLSESWVVESLLSTIRNSINEEGSNLCEK